MKPVFVMTNNVRAYVQTMEIVRKRMGSDSLAMICGRAGRGKTRTSIWYATQNDCIYIPTLRDWSVLWMYQDVLKAMGVHPDDQPRRRKQAFEMILKILEERPRIVIMDEADLLGPRLLESVRDLCKMTRVPWVLVGEEGLPILMNRDRRVWSRRCATMEFAPMNAADIIVYAREATGLLMEETTADMIQ